MSAPQLFDDNIERVTNGGIAVSDYVKAWQCIGCGRIEAPQTCVGICQDRKVEFVYASEHEEALARLELVRRHADALEALVRQLACTNPHDDGWELSYRAMQERARSTLAAISRSPESIPGAGRGHSWDS